MSRIAIQIVSGRDAEVALRDAKRLVSSTFSPRGKEDGSADILGVVTFWVIIRRTRP